MTVESVTYINDLEPDRPRGSDRISQGDDHIRNLKKAIKQTFPNIDGEVSASDEEINYLVGLTEPIKDSIDAGSQDLTALEAEVAKKADKDYVDSQDAAVKDYVDSQNTAQDAAIKDYVDSQNAAQDAAIALKADKTYVDGQNSAQDSVIAQKADISYVDSQNTAQDAVISGKADKSYVDSQNAAQDSAIAQKADKSYVDSQNSGQDAIIAQKADKSYVDSQNNAQDQVINGKADKAYVDSQVGALDQRIDSLELFVSKGGGAMITLAEQPATVGRFNFGQGDYYKSGEYDAVYFADITEGYGVDINLTFNVPNGKVFVMDYITGFGSLDLVLTSIRVDGKSIIPSMAGPSVDHTLQFSDPSDPDWQPYGWPSMQGSASIRIEQSLTFTVSNRSGASSANRIAIAGVFAEA